MGKLKQFLNDVKKEMKRVRWPNKKELLKSSLATILCVAVLSLFFYGLDFLFGTLIKMGG